MSETDQLGQTVLDAVDISEFAVENNFVINVGKGNLCAWRGSGGFDTKERV